MKIIVVGAGRFGSNLFERIEDSHDIVVVEKDEEICERMASETDAIILNGDIRDPDVLEELTLADTDMLISVTGNDETNFLAASYAKKHGVSRVIARASQREYASIMRDLDIEPFIPSVAASERLALSISRPIIHHLVADGVGNFEIFDLTVEEEHLDILDFSIEEKYAGLSVSELPQDEMYRVLSVFREGKFLLPNEDFVLKEGDSLVLLCEAEELQEVMELFD